MDDQKAAFFFEFELNKNMVLVRFAGVIGDSAEAWNEACRRAAHLVLVEHRTVCLENALIFWPRPPTERATGPPGGMRRKGGGSGANSKSTGSSSSSSSSSSSNPGKQPRTAAAGIEVSFCFERRFAVDACRLPELLIGTERPPTTRVVKVETGDPGMLKKLTVAGTGGAWTINIPGLGRVQRRNTFRFNPAEPDVAEASDDESES
jgi:hypothetical protein